MLLIDVAVEEGLAIVERAEVHLYRPGKSGELGEH